MIYVRVFLFVLIASISSYFMLSSGNTYMQSIGQFTPGLTAIIFFFFSLTPNKLSETGLFKLGKFYWYIIAFSLPLIAILISYTFSFYFGFLVLRKSMHFINLPDLFMKIIMISFSWPLLFSFGEELGWRGYLQPMLTKHFGIKYALLLTGIAWFLWHISFIMLGIYFVSGSVIFNSILFAVTVILISFSVGWIRYASGSLWPAVLFHSVSNSALMLIGFQFVESSTYAEYFAGESGIFNIIFWLIMALFVFFKQLKD